MRVELDGGEVIQLGATETAPTIGITDYSRRVTDDFGVTTVVERGFARHMSVRLGVATTAIDALQRRLAALRATAALWAADDTIASLKVRGFYKDFALDLNVPPLSYCTLTIEGLTETASFTDPGGDPAPDGRLSTLRLLQPITVTPAMVVASSNPTDRDAMFDQALGSAATATGSISVTLSAGTVDAVALLDVVAASVRVQAPGFDRTIAPTGTSALFLDIPAASGNVTVTATGSGTVSIGTLLIGHMVALGITEASPTAGITDYSRKVVDDFGEVTIVQRAWAKRMTANAVIRTDAVDAVAGRITAVRALPSLWIADNALDSLTVYGFFKDFSIEVGENISKLSLSIEGLSAAAPVQPLTASAAWPDITDPVGTKPADNATVGATVGVDIKDNTGTVLPPLELLNTALLLTPQGMLTIPGLPDIALGQVVFPDLDESSAAAISQQGTALDMLAAAMLRISSFESQTRAMMRDAGISVDPASGKVSLYALERSDQRLNTVDIQLDAAKAQILLKASTVYVDNAIANAVLDPSQVPVFGQLEARISDVEIDLSALTGSVTLLATTIDLNALGVRVTTARQDIDSLTGVVATKVEATTFNDLEGRVSSAETVIGALGDSASIADTVRASRVLTRRADGTAIQTLADLLAADAAKRQSVAAVAEARRELGAKINDDVSAEAGARLALGLRVGSAEADLVSEQKARISALGVVTSDVQVQKGRITDEISNRTTDVNLARGSAITLNDARVYDIGQLSGRITTEKDDRIAAITDAKQFAIDKDQIVAQTVTDVNIRVNDEISNRVVDVNQARGAAIDLNAARAYDISQLSGRITTETTDRIAAITDAKQFAIDKDQVIAQSVSDVSTTVNGHTSSITGFTQSINGLNARAGIRLDVNGRVTGWVFNNDGTAGGMDIVADYFRLWSPGMAEAQAPFEFVDGVTRIKTAVIGDLTIGTSKVAPGAISSTTYQEGTAGFAVGPSPVCAISVTPFDTNSVFELSFSGVFELSEAPSTNTAYIEVLNQSGVSVFSEVPIFRGAGGSTAPFSFFTVLTGLSGTQTWTLRGRAGTSRTPGAAPHTINGRILAKELKK